ncbi:MAG: ATP-binding protein [Fimbriiglobus sp.]
MFTDEFGRDWTLLTPPGKPAGAVWVERPESTPSTDAERQFFVLSARILERSPAAVELFDPGIDSVRLNQRLADAAVIAGRLAHDFDNVLTGIIGFADLSVPLVPADSLAAKYLAEIGNVGNRGVGFTRQLHQFSRSDRPRPARGSVPIAVAREVERIRAEATTVVNVTTDFPPLIPPVTMDAGPLGVVLGHLLANAVEASPARGPVSVSARVVDLSAADAGGFLGAAAVGSHVELIVEDSGPGMTPAVRTKVFAEPFFTTKVRHRGLGLAIAYRILAAHCGGVRLDPTPGPGTGMVARVVIPLAAAHPVSAAGPATIKG